MKLELTDRYGRKFEADFIKIDRIWEIGGSCDLSYKTGEDFHTINGTLNKFIETIYAKGYNKGFESGYKIGKPKSNKPTVDIEVVPDEDEPKLKGYITDKYGEHILVNSIISYRPTDDGFIKVELANCERAYFDMSLDDFEKMLAKAQEELK